ncbi:MAG: hypothetical protein L0G22_09075 [Propionibacteriaceae bacterium]|nr:hypothetical protein [Propionibacteriaceae bacterium]
MVREESGDVVALLRRWEASGATWRVADLTSDAVTVVLQACTGEEMDRFVVRAGDAARVLVEDAESHG